MKIDLDDSHHLSKISMPPRRPIITSLEFSNSGNQLLVGTSGDIHYIVKSIEEPGDIPGKIPIQRRLIGFEGLERIGTGNGNGPDIGMVPDAGLSGSECCWTPDGKYVLSGE